MYYSNRKYWDFCAPSAGILLTLSFAPFDYSCLALIALVFLFASWQGISARRAALRGYLFGLGAFGSGVSWVYISLHDFGGAGVLVASLLTGLFAAFWAVFPALAGYLWVNTKLGDERAMRVISLPVIWMLIEYFRGYWVLNGFPWLHIAYSQLETPLAGYMPILGVYGTGFVTALTASVALEIIHMAIREGSLFGAKSNFPKFLPLISVEQFKLILVLTVLWGAGGLLQNVAWTHEIGQPLRVSLIQGNIAQDQKWRPENKLNTLLKYQRMTAEHWDSKVIIWPETAIPAYLDQVKETFLAPLDNDAKQHGTDLIISVPVQETAPKNNFNAVITMGKEEGMYRKTHLLPFGEYLPLQPFSGFVLNKMNLRLGNFTPGAINQPLLKAGGYPFITLICYEDVFGDLSIRGLPDAAYLVNVTNDGWFGDSIEPHQHLQMARMRALETGRFLLRATNTGMTAVVSPKGEVINQVPLFQETALTGTITPMGGMTPYAKWGDQPVVGAIVVLLLAVVVYSRFNRLKDLAVEAS
jgi:apolipoprotein N-acyltransferase